MVKAIQERAIRLVYWDPKDRLLKMDDEARRYLQKAEAPLGVVSICGGTRQGKSYMLNKFLGRQNGFKMEKAQDACTEGMWIWSAPISKPDDGDILLLDCQSLDIPPKQDLYFYLCILLSSTMIFNTVGHLRGLRAFRQLESLNKITNYIRLSEKKEKATPLELGEYFPRLHCLIRDYIFEGYKTGEDILTPFLEEALLNKGGENGEISDDHELKTNIRQLFPRRTCSTVVLPLLPETDLCQLQNVAENQLRPEFHNDIRRLRNLIINETRPKMVNGITMTGPVLAGITQRYIDAFNAGQFATIITTWNNVMETLDGGECKMAYDKAVKYYNSILKSVWAKKAARHQKAFRSIDDNVPWCKERVSMEGRVIKAFHEDLEKKMDAAHKEAAAVAVEKIYDSMAVGDSETVERYRRDLLNHMNTTIKNYQGRAVARFGARIIKEVTEDIHEESSVEGSSIPKKVRKASEIKKEDSPSPKKPHKESETMEEVNPFQNTTQSTPKKVLKASEIKKEDSPSPKKPRKESETIEEVNPFQNTTHEESEFKKEENRREWQWLQKGYVRMKENPALQNLECLESILQVRYPMIPVDKDLYGEAGRTYIFLEDCQRLFKVDCMSDRMLTIYLIGLRRKIKNDPHYQKGICFLDASLISTENREREPNVIKDAPNKIVKRFSSRNKDEHIVFIPFCARVHWFLVVVDFETETCYYCNSLKHKGIDKELQKIIKLALKIYARKAGGKETFNWIDVKCPIQRGVECGYCILYYMKRVALEGIGVLKNNFGGPRYRRNDEIDDVRSEWATIAHELIQKHHRPGKRTKNRVKPAKAPCSAQILEVSD